MRLWEVSGGMRHRHSIRTRLHARNALDGLVLEDGLINPMAASVAGMEVGRLLREGFSKRRYKEQPRDTPPAARHPSRDQKGLEESPRDVLTCLRLQRRPPPVLYRVPRGGIAKLRHTLHPSLRPQVCR